MDAHDLLGTTVDPSTPETRAAMVMTLFGAFGRGGSSGALGNDLDSELLQSLRAWADVVLVSASTVTAEDYGPADTPLAILSRSLDLSTSLGVFGGREVIVACPEPSLIDDSLADRRRALEQAGARFVSTGTGSLGEAVNALRSEGFNRIACEGGPSVYAAMIGADLLDVIHLTLDPTVSNDDSTWGLPAIAQQAVFARRYALEATHATDDGTLFLRYLRAGDRSEH